VDSHLGLDKYAVWEVVGTQLRLVGINTKGASLTGTLDLTGCSALRYLYCYNNFDSGGLTALNLTGCTALEELSCRGNSLKFSTLNLPANWTGSIESDNWYSSGQAEVSIPSLLGSDNTINISSENIRGKTAFTWYYGDGERRVSSSLYTEDNGVFTFTGLQNGDRIYCRMTNTDYPSLVLYTTEIRIIVTAVPTGLRSTEQTANAITLQWNATGNTAGYEIQYRRVGTTDWTTIPSSSASGTSVTVSRLVADTTYEFRIRAKAADGGYSEWSTLMSTKTTAEQKIDRIITNTAGNGYATIKGVNANSRAATVNSVTLNWTPDATQSETNQFVMEVCIPKKRKIEAKIIATITMTIGEDGSLSWQVFGLKHDDVLIESEFITQTSRNLGFKYTITITGLQQGTKYTIQMQASKDNQLSKMIKVSASTKKYTSVKAAGKATPGLGAVTLRWNASTNVAFASGVIVGKKTYEVAIYNANTKTYLFAGDESFDLLAADIRGFDAVNQENRTVTISGLASQRYTFGVREVAELKDGDGNVISTVESAIAKFSASPSAYKAPKFEKPATGITTLNLMSASVTNPRSGDQFYGYEVGVYDNRTKQYVWGTASILTDDTHEDTDGKDWTLTGTKGGMKIAVREVLYVSETDKTVIAKSAMTKISLK